METPEIERLLSRGFERGTEGFRDDLLARCLAVLGENEVRELNDDDLGLLSAAGTGYIIPEDKLS